MEDLIHHFGINWKLLLAQAINFFILLFVLKRYAFGPVMKVLRRRREEVEKGIALKKEAEERIGHIARERDEVVSEARKEALALMTHTEEDAKKKREEIRKAAGKEAENIIHEARRRAEEEKKKTGEAMYQNAQSLLKESLSRILGKMPSGERDGQLIKEALEELRGLKNFGD